ncbi:MAG TPA: heparan-alpha-glucosaminide N-acetyltransferase domain-containing protein, partial [Chitinophagaceae bacterium]|nr:heparan-alpha-glucosaminide N-acetyltransferase domain-containing protein [Chitinophagaceae bacterium]
DILRGLVMVIMALDHVRDFFFKANVSGGGASVAMDPTNLATTTPALFFTRWITHFCAPVFIFLAGTSVYLMSRKKTRRELSLFLIKRGFWLILVEVIIITFAWTFNPFFNLLILQVIWTFGISMIILGVLIWLPFQFIFVLGFVIVFGHNLLNYDSISKGLKGGFLSDLLYFSDFSSYPINKTHFIFIVYSFVPWTGLMMLGYCFGKLYENTIDPLKRRKILLILGTALVVLFILLRLMKGYGDPVPFSQQARGSFFTFLSFLNVNKYPPSLAYLSMTIGPAMILLALLENIQNRLTGFFRVYGRVPLFYYILHFYIIHTVGVIVFFLQGFSISQISEPGNPFLFKPNGFGFGLLGVYAVWLFVFLVLYPLCKKYDRYKSAHQNWWLSYL